MGLRPVDDVRTAPLTALELVGGHLVARESGICPLGGALLGAAGLCAGRTWLVEGGPAVAGGLGVLYLLGFGASHPLAKRIGAWPSVPTVAAVDAAAAHALVDER